MFKTNIHLYILFLIKNPYKFILTLMYPKYFPSGSDTSQIIINDNISVTKFFKSKYIFNKSIKFIEIVSNQHFIPTSIYIDKTKNILIQEYCGNVIDIRHNLPKNWKSQLNYVRNIFISKNILITDINLFDLNPYIIYNLCIKNNIIYLIDFGDWKYSNSYEINNYFDQLIFKITFIKNLNIIFVFLYIFSILLYKLIKSLLKKFKKIIASLISYKNHYYKIEKLL